VPETFWVPVAAAGVVTLMQGSRGRWGRGEWFWGEEWWFLCRCSGNTCGRSRGRGKENRLTRRPDETKDFEAKGMIQRLVISVFECREMLDRIQIN